MKIASWNVNSVRARLERLLAFLDRHAPDVVCLQELKVEDSAFPYDELKTKGYESAVLGQKTYNGVAILSRLGLDRVEKGLGDAAAETDVQSRLIAATVNGIRVASVYVPNGGEIGSDKWTYKLEFYRRLRAWVDEKKLADSPFALCGDYNVAPEERDVSSVAEWEPTVLFHPDARAALKTLTDAGLVDTYRLHVPEAGKYSWWDYRMLAFPKNNGLRIDHILASKALAARSIGAVIDRDERKGKLPSDHAPVIGEFAD